LIRKGESRGRGKDTNQESYTCPGEQGNSERQAGMEEEGELTVEKDGCSEIKIQVHVVFHCPATVQLKQLSSWDI
jgi:hypothetical protein